jgi:hypothetical protein
MLRKIAVLTLVLIASLAAQVSVFSVADITGDNASHVLQSSGTARWIQIVTPSTNSAAVRVGDSAVSATEGIAIAPGGGFMFPVISIDTRDSSQAKMYQLSGIRYFAATGDKLNLVWGR